MNRGALAAMMLLATAAAGFERHALVLGQNEGTGSDGPLQFAEADAERTAAALIETGTVERQRLVLVKSATLDTARAQLRELAGRVKADDEVIVFFSGHGGSDGLHLSGEVFAWKELSATLAALPARLVIAFFDACFSGAMFTAKGLSRESALTISMREGGRGRFLISSSGANELSYESNLIGGSPFSSALRTGLRGAADLDHDGRVTLPELYEFIYRRTVASTIASPTGPQHPVESSELNASGEVVLAKVANSNRARVSGWSRGGRCYLLDRGDLEVLAELAAAGEEVALPPGEYSVECVVDDRLWTARGVFGAAPTSLDSLRFETRAAPSQLAKGENGAPVYRLSAALGYGTGAGGAGAWLSFRDGTRALGWGVQVSAQLGGELAATLSVSTRLPWWRAFGSEASIGIAMEGAAMAPFHSAQLGGGAFADVDGGELLSHLHWYAHVELVALEPTTGGPLLGRVCLALGVAWNL